VLLHLDDCLVRAIVDSLPFEALLHRLKIYFDGHPVNFEESLDLTGASHFQRQVWEAIRSIPYGEKRSYSWVAERIGRPGAARAVGQALARNPVPIIVPCHRVVTNEGKLGGFSYGPFMKQYLLQLEAGA
jgi:methylated-DNA-[protein]-cysteine S-methyltransferase